MKAKITDPYSEFFECEVEILGGHPDMEGLVFFDVRFPNGIIRNFSERDIEPIK